MPRTARHVDHTRRRRVLKWLALTVAVLLVAGATAGFLAYRQLDKNITSIDVTRDLGTDRPTHAALKPGVPDKPLNVLVLGSDTREGQGPSIAGETPGLSDTTILLHLSADRQRAYGVSLPRDAMVKRPSCRTKGGSIDPGGLSMFNEAYAVGGPACTIKTVESLTRVPIDHFVVIDFKGFRKMVDALGGVEVCVPEEVDDDIGRIYLPAGTYTVKGQRALDYVRVRHDIGAENGDIGRMKRQQVFLASMSNKAVSAGTLANPVRLYKFLNEATKSLTTDPGLASLRELVILGQSFQGIGLDNIQFLSVPFELYPPDPNRLQWKPSANRLWKAMIDDEPVGKRLVSGAVSAEDESRPSKGGEKSPSTSPSATASTDAAARRAAENGLCA